VVRIIPLDVTNLESVRQAATQIEESIDILINGAGIAGKRDQKTGNVDYESWREVLNVNTMGPLRVTEAFRRSFGSQGPSQGIAADYFSSVARNAMKSSI
jgi:NAD(P)-dependent dehydrogenase (short-subunit alcohol dehydrogenase family)